MLLGDGSESVGLLLLMAATVSLSVALTFAISEYWRRPK
jgi:hypothetical protein